MLPERSFKSNTERQSWTASVLILVCAGFFLLLLREGNPEPYQRVADSIFHNWMAMGLVALGLVAIRRWDMPRVFRLLSGFLLLLAGLITGLGLIAWPPFWKAVSTFGVPRTAQPVIGLTLVAVWLVLCFGVLIRTLIRWLHERYEHHGFALGVGPLYFYFRRRRAHFRSVSNLSRNL
jgi:hypothetical protein